MVKSREELINTVDTIPLIEATLAEWDNTETKEIRKEEVFSYRNICFYRQLGGAAYLKLIKFCNQDVNSYKKLSNSYVKYKSDSGIKDEDIFRPPPWEECISRCDELTRQSLLTASNHLEITDPLRLLCVYSACESLCVLRQAHIKARDFAEKVVLMASAHTNLVDDSVLNILQRLRDDFMQYSKATSSGEMEVKAKSERQEEVMGSPPPHSHPRPSLLVHPIDDTLLDVVDLKDKRRIDEEKEWLSRSNGKLGNSTNDFKEIFEDSGYTFTRIMKANLLLPEPILFESLSSATAIARALDKIFRVYVRGNAVAGQLKATECVEIDGRHVKLSNFILEGPYMSFKGFTNVLQDFKIAKVKNALSQSTSTKVLPSQPPDKDDSRTARASGFAGEGGAVDPLLSLMEAAAVFIESSLSTRPALVMNKYLDKYNKLGETITSGVNASERDGIARGLGNGPGEVSGAIHSDNSRTSWEAVQRWASQDSRRRNRWDHIKGGINFMQFVDCMGKLALMSFDKERSSHLEFFLPTPRHKMEHLFSAYLGLVDPKRLRGTLERKVKNVKMVMSRVRNPIIVRSPSTSPVAPG